VGLEEIGADGGILQAERLLGVTYQDQPTGRFVGKKFDLVDWGVQGGEPYLC